MSITYSQAVDEINTMFLNAWNANSNAIAGYIPEIRWEGNEREPIPDNKLFWCRASIKSVLEQQASLANSVGIPGQRIFTAHGLVIVQLFCPKNVLNSLPVGRQLAGVAQNAFRGKASPGGVWFLNVTVKDFPQEENWYRLNVVAQYSYDEIH